MSEAVSSVAPFVIAGSILPTWTLMVIILLGTSRPLANSLSFVAGNAVFRLALGTAALFVLSLPSGDVFDLSSPRWDARVTAALGLVLAVLGVRGLLKARPVSDSPLLDRFERLSPVASFTAGVVTVASPGIQWVYFLGAVSAIRAEVDGAAAGIVAIVAVTVALQWMLMSPVAVYALFRSRADAGLSRAKAWLRRNGRRVGSGVLVGVGLYMVVTSITGI